MTDRLRCGGCLRWFVGRGQYGEGLKSVKKNAALLHFLTFGALNRASEPALLDGGHRFSRQARCLGTARLFSLPFLVTKKVGLPEESHYKRVSPHGGDTPLLFIQKNQ